MLLLSGAALRDRFGRRRMFTIGLGLFTAGLRRGRARAFNEGAFVAARAVQGIRAGRSSRR